MSNVDFQIINALGTVSPYSDRGMDALAGEALTFKIEASPALDLREVQFSVVSASSAAEFALWSWTPSTGKPTTPTGTVTVTAPAAGSYFIRCTGNGGQDAYGLPVADWVRERIVVVRQGGARKMVPGETTQYDATYGWVEAFNALVTAQAGTVPVTGTVTVSDGASHTLLVVEVPDKSIGVLEVTVAASNAAGTEVGACNLKAIYTRNGASAVYRGLLSIGDDDNAYFRGGAGSPPGVTPDMDATGTTARAKVTNDLVGTPALKFLGSARWLTLGAYTT